MTASIDPRNALGPWSVDPRCPWIPTDDRIVLMKCADKEKIGPAGIIDPTQRDLTRFVIVGLGVNATVSTVPNGAANGIGLGDVVMIPGDHVVTLLHNGRPYFVVPGSSVMMIQAQGGTKEADEWATEARYEVDFDDAPPRILIPKTGPTGLVGPNGKPVG